MKKVMKKMGKEILAYKLGTECEVLDALIREGKLRKNEDGTYEVFSREAVNGVGQTACTGDYIKIDGGGYPYPNTAKYFSENHRLIDGNRYEQFSKVLDAWFASDGMCPEVQFLIEKKGLVIQEAVTEKYFTAPIRGSVLSADKDAVIVFRDLKRSEDGNVLDTDFDFVAREEFEKNYNII